MGDWDVTKPAEPLLDTPTKVLDAHITALRDAAARANNAVASLEAQLESAKRNRSEAIARLNAFLAEMDKR